MKKIAIMMVCMLMTVFTTMQAQSSKSPFIGDWELKAGGPLDGTTLGLSIKDDGGKLKGILAAPSLGANQIELGNIQVVSGKELKYSFGIQGIDVEASMVLKDNNSLTGTLAGQYPFEGKRNNNIMAQLSQGQSATNAVPERSDKIGAGMTPTMSEYWSPKPKVVTPGNQATASAPSDAIVLFDGTEKSMTDNWVTVNMRTQEVAPAKWIIKDGAMTVNKDMRNGGGNIQTKESFGSFQLHIEWCVPEMSAEFTSQIRGNSGVYLQNMYEVQILDSYNNDTYVNGMAGSIYKQSAPLANAMRKPGEWNVFDIIYDAPVFNADGTYKVRPYVTVIQNGVVLQNHTEILGTTEYIGFPQVKVHGDGPILLQNHGDPSPNISFRNIWIRKM